MRRHEHVEEKSLTKPLGLVTELLKSYFVRLIDASFVQRLTLLYNPRPLKRNITLSCNVPAFHKKKKKKKIYDKKQIDQKIQKYIQRRPSCRVQPGPVPHPESRTERNSIPESMARTHTARSMARSPRPPQQDAAAIPSKPLNVQNDIWKTKWPAGKDVKQNKEFSLLSVLLSQVTR